MRLNPVPGALDFDQDGDISAAEIMNSSSALKTLDKDRDGSLTLVEVIPDANDSRAELILSRLDKDRDGKLSRQERASEGAELLWELLDRANSNGDGVTTADELRKELRLRDELSRQMEEAMR
jgi:Ca2+-binding EF-hand superfamily protein